MLNSGMKNWNFHYETTESSDGNILNVQTGWLSADIEITGEAGTTSTVIFWGKSVDNGLWYHLPCINKSTFEMNHEVSDMNTVWAMDLVGLIQVKCEVINVSGSITIKARIVG
jgi:hypothetical protein